MSDPDRRPCNELGRRLFAAVESYQRGQRGVDYTLREHVPPIVDPFWCELGERLLDNNQEHVMDLFAAPGGKPRLVVNNTPRKDTSEPF